MSLINELKRRNVFRVAFAYAVVGWVVLQVADTVVPVMGLPEWSMRMLLFVGMAGFPFAILFAWAFELTPEGIRRTEDVQPGDSITPETGGKLNRIIIGLLSVALLLVVVERLSLDKVEEEAEVVASVAQITSIAVLPFVNMSDDRANEHFGDGLAEELLNLLAKVPELHVAARTSSFYFKDKDVKIKEVADALNVQSVLEGSVRRSGDTIRVVAQLINAADGSHLWSERYDRPLTDVFKVQDDISRQIVQALMPHLDVEDVIESSNAAGEISPELYARFLLAKQRYYDRNPGSIDEAHREFLAITREAPTFAAGWSWLARSWISRPELPISESHPPAREAIATALRLQPGEPLAMTMQADILAATGDFSGALAILDQVVAQQPGFVDALLARQFPLVNLGRADEAITSLKLARRLDPLHPNVLWSLAHLLNLQGKTAEAFDIVDNLHRVNPARATAMELHIYGDNGAFPQLVYFLEDTLDSDRRDHIRPLFAGVWTMEFGLHDHPAIAASVFGPAALVYSQGRDAAEQALALRLAELENLRLRVVTEMQVRIALGEYDIASDLLWNYWKSLDQEGFSDDFWELHADYLCAAATIAGHTERLGVMLPMLHESVAKDSKLHNGDYQMNQATLAIFEGRHEDAIERYQVIADNGGIGDFTHNSPIHFGFLVADDSRYDAVRAQLTANRDRQLQELNQLRESGVSVRQMRQDYLAQLP